MEANSNGIFRFGEDPGAGNVVKLCGNYMIACAIVARKLSLAEKSGLKREDVMTMLNTTIFDCLICRGYGDRVAQRKHIPGESDLVGPGSSSARPQGCDARARRGAQDAGADAVRVGPARPLPRLARPWPRPDGLERDRPLCLRRCRRGREQARAALATGKVTSRLEGWGERHGYPQRTDLVALPLRVSACARVARPVATRWCDTTVGGYTAGVQPRRP